MSALRNRIGKIERRRPDIEWELAQERARYDTDLIFATAPLSESGGPLPMSRLRELFGPDFLAPPRLRRRRR